jgi:hypothetical protein
VTWHGDEGLCGWSVCSVPGEAAWPWLVLSGSQFKSCAPDGARPHLRDFHVWDARPDDAVAAADTAATAASVAAADAAPISTGGPWPVRFQCETPRGGNPRYDVERPAFGLAALARPAHWHPCPSLHSVPQESADAQCPCVPPLDIAPLCLPQNARPMGLPLSLSCLPSLLARRAN